MYSSNSRRRISASVRRTENTPMNRIPRTRRQQPPSPTGSTGYMQVKLEATLNAATDDGTNGIVYGDSTATMLYDDGTALQDAGTITIYNAHNAACTIATGYKVCDVFGRKNKYWICSADCDEVT